MYSFFVKMMRQWQKIKQKELARRLGFSQAYLSDLENGKKPISLETLFNILEVLDTDLDHFDIRKPLILTKKNSE